MRIKLTVKFSDKGHLLVDLPYKHGHVTWALNFNNNKMDWILFHSPTNYNPERVRVDHIHILSGQRLKTKMMSAAAATHKYTVLSKLRTVQRN